MEKKTKGNYFLVFEPKYEFVQYAVYFDSDGKTRITKIDRYSDKPFDKAKKSKIKKNTLSDIDRITASCESLEEFFEKYVDPSIFVYHGDNLHEIFIAKSSDDSVFTMKCIFNNRELLESLQHLDGSKIYDKITASDIKDLVINSNNNDFMNFVKSEKIMYRTGISNSVINNCLALRYACNYNEGYSVVSELEEEFFNNLKIYKNFREMFLLRSNYISLLERRKANLHSLREDLQQTLENSTETSKTNEPNAFGYDPNAKVEQLDMFDVLDGKVKTLGKKE